MKIFSILANQYTILYLKRDTFKFFNYLIINNEVVTFV